MSYIAKYELRGPTCILSMPKQAKPLCVMLEDIGHLQSALYLYALIDPSNDSESRTFIVAIKGEVVVREDVSFIGAVHNAQQTYLVFGAHK